MRVFQEVITFDGGGAKVSARIAALGTRFARMFAEPDSGNTHVCYVGDAALAIGTSTVVHVIKRIAKPSAADALLDNYDLGAYNGTSDYNYKDFSFDGTSGEKLRLTFYEH